MNDEQKKNLIAWLNDAHAMELSLIKNMEGKARDAEEAGKMEVKARINEHIVETRRQAELVESCIVRLGGNPSFVKDTVGKATGYVQGVMNSMYSDTMVKNAIETHAAERFEIAAYTSIIAAAEEVGDMETAAICTRILEEEKKMAEWTEELIKTATKEYLISLSSTV